MSVNWKPSRGYYRLEELIHDDLSLKMAENTAPERRRKKLFFEQLLRAWDAFAYDSYEPGSGLKKYAESSLARYYEETNIDFIRLSGSQVKTINALAEVAGMPYKTGKDIQIPKSIVSYEK